jgi:hypothetical protein
MSENPLQFERGTESEMCIELQTSQEKLREPDASVGAEEAKGLNRGE